jgi:hypothetical protein
VTLSNVLLWVQRVSVFVGCAALLTVFLAPRVILGGAVGNLASEYEKAGIDTSDCRSWTKSPYVTGDGRCLEKPMSEIRSRMPQFPPGGPDGSRHEAPPIE